MIKLFVLWLTILLSGCTHFYTTKERQLNIIPKPQSVNVNNGVFTIEPDTKILHGNHFKDITKVVNYFNQYLTTSTGFGLKVSDTNITTNFIHLRYDEKIENEEGYKLTSDGNGITISASASIGLFYGVQTLLQILPEEIYSQQKSAFPLNVPFVEINDEPRFKWRGIMLDVARHYYAKEDIKKFIDYLAIHKMRQFHWHLTDDQGWRIEIKKYPKLAEISAYRKESMLGHYRDSKYDGTTYGGFYSQDDIREIVKYADDRFITIIPEIEMPGHALAALAAYPEYSCTNGPFEVGTTWGVLEDVFCAGNENTYKFLEDILTEVIELFPGKYIHIGGDECPKARWENCEKCQVKIINEKLKDEHELQSYFIKRMAAFLSKKNRKLIGWDEILEGGLAPHATVMSWQGTQGGIDAAKQNHDAIMSPTSHCYFDYYQGNPENEPVAIGGCIPLSLVYSFEPIPEELSTEEAKYILGAQANVWSEYLHKFKKVEYMLLPRLSALSEVCWTNSGSKNIDDFLLRMDKQFQRYDKLGANYAKSSFNVTIGTTFNEYTKTFDIELSAEMPDVDIYYSLEGSDPNRHSNKYTKPFSINSSTIIKAVSYRKNKLKSAITKRNITIHKAFGKKVKTKNPYSENYTAGGDLGLVNGLFGSTSFTDGAWQGYEQIDFEAIIDLGNRVQINKIELTFLQRTNSWIFLPKYVEYSFSTDGKNFSKPIILSNNIPENRDEVFTQKFTSELENLKAKYVKVFAKNIEKCPEWHIGAGGKAFIFIDEIVIN